MFPLSLQILLRLPGVDSDMIHHNEGANGMKYFGEFIIIFALFTGARSHLGFQCRANLPRAIRPSALHRRN
jgi:hypothetical protein